MRAVDQLSFQIRPGEVFGLLGPNGDGKTTTLRMVLGLLQPDGGYAEVDGFRTADDPISVKSKLGFVSASDGVLRTFLPSFRIIFSGGRALLTEASVAVTVGQDEETFAFMRRTDFFRCKQTRRNPVTH